ncbi:YjzD family protein [Levilactobacillus bambusae]|uniref:DUF2929 domain-containing protein n=1 Tax=Levilactobacillus bambusae TaxID=2024736 RepID=A0A2V1MZI0_9LACO|nr:YjzD family protein [Levilactobacillus bambusae]PWG00173.1 DUF2929 domain-containing protein [Levilactobacillus bambusae]
MRTLAANLTVAFWAALFGEVIGYIGGALEQMTYNPGEIAIVCVIVALLGVNGIAFLSREDAAAMNAESAKERAEH